jgi:hypothetical protein
LEEFPLVVLPECYKLADEFKKALLAYVNEGGNLLIFGAEPARLFMPAVGVEFEGEPQNVRAELATSLGPVNANGQWQNVKLTGAKAVGYRHPDRDTRKNGQVAASINQHGKGKIGAIYGPVAIGFFRCHHPYLREFIGDLTGRLFPEPAVQIDGPPCIDISLRRTNDGRLSLHLLNLANVPLSNRHNVIDFIPSVGPIRVTMRAEAKPTEVIWVPDESPLKWSWADGRLSVQIPSLHVHGVLVVR